MKQSVKQFAVATAMLVGTVIGVGIFGVPYAIAQVGVLGALAYFAVLGGIQLLQHLSLAEAALAVPQKIRFVGMVDHFLGPRARGVASVSLVLGYWAGLLAYNLVGGTFLHTLFGSLIGGSEFAWQVGWSLVAGCITSVGLKGIAKMDFFATVALAGTLLAIIAACVGRFDASHVAAYTGHDLFLPYGVVLFSLSGLPAILEMEDLFGRSAHRMYRASVVAGTVIATLLTLAFGIAVWGATGSGVSTNVGQTLTAVFGARFGMLVAACGFLAVFTSYFGTAVNLQSTFQYDYKMPHWAAWLATGAVPFALMLWGTRDFVSVVSFSGSVFGGMTAVMVGLIYLAVVNRKAVKVKPIGIPKWLTWGSIVLLALGAGYEVWVSGLGLVRSWRA